MKLISSKLIMFLAVAGMILSGCDANNTQKGAGIGAAAGAIIGGIIGNNVGSKDNAAAGAIAGAVIGGAAGGIIGHKMDQQAKKIENTLPGAEVVRNAEGIQVILDENSDVRFEYNKSSLTAEAKSNLQKLIPIFNEYPDTDMLIIGFTDGVGSQEYNLPLSEKRAGSVVEYLKSQGIASSRLTSMGRGKLEPRADNETEAGRAQNRRVEFVITANEKMKAEAEQEAGN